MRLPPAELFRRGSLAAALVLSGLECESPRYAVFPDQVYDPRTKYGVFDYYEPLRDRTRIGRPALLAIHGGAWKEGTKDWGNQIAAEFCPYGYVVFSIDYRLSGDASWPAQIHDVQAALRYIRDNAKRFRIDPNRIASVGMSAGGHLATMVALRNDSVSPRGRVTTAINLDGEHDMTMPPSQVMADYDEILTKVMGHAGPWSDAELRDISTVTFARKDVGLLTIHGVGDDNVFFPQAERITSALRAKGADVELVKLEGTAGNCHSDCWKNPAAKAAMHRFLERRLSYDANQFFTAFR